MYFRVIYVECVNVYYLWCIDVFSDDDVKRDCKCIGCD